MEPEDAIHLLDGLGVVSQPCDLDLLLFFVTHPRCLLPSETLAAFLGYETKVMADSLDTLLAARLITRRQTPAHAARLYVLAAEPETAEWVAPLLQVASTRAGRLALRDALLSRASQSPAPTAQSSRPRPRPRPHATSEDGRPDVG